MSDGKEKEIKSQKERFNKEAADYCKSHGDFYSQKYRDIFMRSLLFSYDLTDKNILEAMCAYGTETGYLLKRGARVIGLDISEENARLYEKIWKLDCKVGSIHKTDFPDESFDIVYIYGGLHHVLYLLDEVMKEVYRILKTGGYFCFVEPNKDTWFNFFRKTWYRVDQRFTEDEDSISYEKTLKPFLKLGYKEKVFSYGGGLAYLIFAQSMILKTPQILKRLFWSPLCFLEKKLQGKRLNLNLFFLAVWQKQ